ncbi:MAG: glycosyltransferase family 39 protein [Deltaproteobacteria bacterium]|nr:glycosyltransferase family 39 protein [Deltaproteobacteria bacterium]
MTKSFTFTAVVFLAVLASRSLFLFFPSSFHFSYEEAHQGILALHLGRGLVLPLGDYAYESYAGGTVFSGLLAALPFKIFGPTLFALRLPSLILSAAGAACYAFAFYRYAGPLAGIAAAIVLTVYPPYPASMDVTAFGNHAELASLGGALFLLFARVVFDKRKAGIASAALLGAAVGFCVYYDHLAVLFLPAAIAVWIWTQKKGLAARGAAGFLAGMAAGLSTSFLTGGPVLLVKRIFGFAETPPGGVWPESPNFLLASTGLSTGGSIALLAFVAGCAAAWLALNRRGLTRETRPENLELCVLLVAAAYVGAVAALRPHAPARYALPVWPLLAVVPAMLARRGKAWILPSLVLAAVALAGWPAHLRAKVEPALFERGYSYRLFLPTYAHHRAIGARARKLIDEAEANDPWDAEDLYEGYVIGHAALSGRDVRGHLRALTRPDGTLPEKFIEGVRRAYADAGGSAPTGRDQFPADFFNDE